VLHGAEGARRLADESAEKTGARVDADTTVLREIVDGIALRTA